MKKLVFRVLIYIIMFNLIINSIFFIFNSYGLVKEIDSEFGESPIIDGYIDFSQNEWNKATKVPISLEDLPIDLWVMQDDKNLYISVQFDLEIEAHKDNEFIGIIISNSSSIVQDEFIDAKIVQFSNKSSNDFNYLDYHINNSIFLNDTYYNGEGAAKIKGIHSTYEFSLPINSIIGIQTNEDVLLDYGNVYAFNITYGETPFYPEGIKKMNTVLINIKSLSKSQNLDTHLAIYILAIVIFSIIGVIYGFYVYKIFKLKKLIQRIKR